MTIQNVRYPDPDQPNEAHGVECECPLCERVFAPTPRDPAALDILDPDTADSYVCPDCRNRTDTDGFCAVDPDGRWVEPTPDWDGTYACADCGRRSRIK